MTASEKVKSLVASGEALDAVEAIEMLVDMGEISWATADRMQAKLSGEKLECEGHEHDPGNPTQIAGFTYYCDGSCR